MKETTRTALAAVLGSDETVTNQERQLVAQLLEGRAEPSLKSGPLLTFSAASRLLGISRPTMRAVIKHISADPKIPSELLPQLLTPTTYRIGPALFEYLQNGCGAIYCPRAPAQTARGEGKRETVQHSNPFRSVISPK
jgi:hypothetical protein